MSDYYSSSLSSSKLKKCYDIAPTRIKQNLEAEIDFVLDRIKSTDRVLELGCGYGRVIKRIIEKTQSVVGIDSSQESIHFARESINDGDLCEFYVMNAINLDFSEHEFDIVLCIQNGISSFQVNPERLMAEAIRVTKNNGFVLFSSYSEKFWEERLNWFKIQSENELIGEIDYDHTGSGVIVCKDGFKATTVSSQEFRLWSSKFPVTTEIFEVDDSSIFCEMRVL